jgi:hypothetical protein
LANSSDFRFLTNPNVKGEAILSRIMLNYVAYFMLEMLIHTSNLLGLLELVGVVYK